MAIMLFVSAHLVATVFTNGRAEKSAARLSGHALQALIEEMEQYLSTLRRVSNGKQVTALEGSIRDARQRLHSQQYENGITPTQPRGSIGRR